MRELGGLKVINKAIEKLGKEHNSHIKLYDSTGVSGHREGVMFHYEFHPLATSHNVSLIEACELSAVCSDNFILICTHTHRERTSKG